MVLVLSLLTIVLWSTLDFTRPLLGDLGIVSLLFITFMFGSGMLTQVTSAMHDARTWEAGGLTMAT